jgi:hypothetical protein
MQNIENYTPRYEKLSIVFDCETADCEGLELTKHGTRSHRLRWVPVPKFPIYRDLL